MPSRKGGNFWSKFEAQFAGRRVVASFEVELLAAETKITMQGARDTLRRHGWKTMRWHRDPNYYWCQASCRSLWGTWTNDGLVAYFAEKKLMKPARVLAYARRRAIQDAAIAEMKRDVRARLVNASPEEKAKLLVALTALAQM